MTPKSYLSFINGYETIYSEKHSEIGELANRMQTGLDKLIEASESVAQLSKELVVKEKDLAVASIKADTVCFYSLVSTYISPPILIILLFYFSFVTHN